MKHAMNNDFNVLIQPVTSPTAASHQLTPFAHIGKYHTNLDDIILPRFPVSSKAAGKRIHQESQSLLRQQHADQDHILVPTDATHSHTAEDANNQSSNTRDAPALQDGIGHPQGQGNTIANRYAQLYNQRLNRIRT